MNSMLPIEGKVGPIPWDSAIKQKQKLGQAKALLNQPLK